MDQVENAILKTLWETWLAEPIDVPHNGNRLFVRYVDFDPKDSGWNDWSLVGLVDAARRITWNDPRDDDSEVGMKISEPVSAGERHGRFDYACAKFEWGLFVGDGPTEARVSDWIGDDGDSRAILENRD